MTTPATYLIENEATYGVRACFFISTDGFPQGAAECFAAMYKARNGEHRGLAESFLIGNFDAELTRDHELHGDTDYRYSLSENGILTAQKRLRVGFKTFFIGACYQFINKYLDKDAAHRLYLFTTSESGEQSVMTLKEAEDYAQKLSVRVSRYETEGMMSSDGIRRQQNNLKLINKQIVKLQKRLTRQNPPKNEGETHV